MADFVARPPDAAAPGRAAARHARCPSDADLDTPGPPRSLAYDRAWWFARFVADSYGRRPLRRLYVAACGPGHADCRDRGHPRRSAPTSPGCARRWRAVADPLA